MEYKKLPYQRYFIDQSQGSRGGKPRVKIDYIEIIYEHNGHSHTIYHYIYWDADRNVLQFCFKETLDKDAFFIHRLFNLYKYHTEYWKEDYYKSID